MKILVTGATGYIGGRLVPLLLEAGHEVRCLARDPGKLAHDSWRDRVEVIRGDLLDPSTLAGAMEGCDAAYYLVHSMDGGGGDFRERDRAAAINFREAADAIGLGRIVYLGGLGRGDHLSKHLTSRQEVGAVLAAGSTPVTELRAAVIIGSGSVSFEMLRYLTEVLPVMITPMWVRTRCQPVAIRNVLEALISAVTEQGPSRVVEIGGPDVLTYEEMMRVYAEEAGLRRRLIIPVPVLSPRLSSHWVGLVTPLPTGVAKPLVDSLRNEVIVADMTETKALVGDLLSYRDAVRASLTSAAGAGVSTRWSDASTNPARPLPSDPHWSGGTLLMDEKMVTSTAAPDDVYWAFARIGGTAGYYTLDWAWRLRGLLDDVVGGAGLRRGRRHPEELHKGEALDFWRVAAANPGRTLLLHAEMKLPGDAWLEWEAIPSGNGRTTLRQTAYFAPRGLLGRAYWYALRPFHVAIFGRMARKIAAAAEQRRTGDGRRHPAEPT